MTTPQEDADERNRAGRPHESGDAPETQAVRPPSRPDTVGPRGNQDIDDDDVQRGEEKLDRLMTH